MKDKIIWAIDVLQEKFAIPKKIDPNKLLTKNRHDIKIRIEFLKDILENEKSIEQTMYFQFVSDDKRRAHPPLEAKEMCKNFLTLFKDVKMNGISKPLNVAKLNSLTVKTGYFFDGKQVWVDFPNDTGYQLMNGAHRLAIATYLKFENIPAKIFTPIAFPFPNYTDYIILREEEYMKKMEN